MATYFLNEAQFTLPDLGFVDRTLHRLESPVAGGEDPLSVEIRRVPMPPGATLKQLVRDEIATAKTTVNGFAVVDEAVIDVAGAPAIVLRTRLRARDALYVQLQAHVVLGETWIAVVVGGPNAERAACDETFERIVRSLQWR